MKRCVIDGIDEPISVDTAQHVAQFFKVFGDANRIRLLMLLQDHEVCVNHLAKALDMSISAVSHQLRILRQHHLVRYVRDGKEIFYTLDDEHVALVLSQGFEHLIEKGEI